MVPVEVDTHWFTGWLTVNPVPFVLGAQMAHFPSSPDLLHFTSSLVLYHISASVVKLPLIFQTRIFRLHICQKG